MSAPDFVLTLLRRLGRVHVRTVARRSNLHDALLEVWLGLELLAHGDQVLQHSEGVGTLEHG